MSSGRPGARLAAMAGSWRVALRIAWREARRARGRTALVLAMITLPVLVLAFAVTILDMSELTRAERVARQLGVADAELLAVARGPVRQTPWGDGWDSPAGDVVPPAPVTPEQVAALLPPGSRVLRLQRWAAFEARVDDRVVNSVSGRIVDLTDPLGHGLVRLHAGRPPTAPGEIAANPAALRRLDARLGGTVTSADRRGTWTVVGVVEFPDHLHPLVTLPPAVHAEGDASWLVDLPGPAGNDLFRRLNDHGYVVQARTPGPPPGDGLSPEAYSSVDLAEAGGAVLVGGLALLEVVLLVGPAFAVGVRRRRRDLALVAVAGGDDAHLRRIVLADGVVLGALGAVTGLTLGVAAAVAARPLVEEYAFGERFGGYRSPPVLLLAIAAVAVLAGVLAALAPAWTAARQDVVAGLAGRRTPPAYRRRWLLAGVALTGLGAVVAAAGAVWTDATVILAGIVLGELGLVLATPALVGLLARAGRVLPLAPRIALRDASRNRSSAAPAISAVMAAVAGSVAVGVWLASEEARSNDSWTPGLPAGTVLVTWADAPGATTGPADGRLAGPTPLPEGEVAAAARTHLGGHGLVPLVELGCAAADDPCHIAPVLPPGRACPWPAGDRLTEAEHRQARADERCRRGPDDHWGPYVAVTVDDGRALPLLTGAEPAESAAAAAVLRAGGAVVTDPRYLVDGRLEIVARDGPDGAISVRAAVPGYALRTGLAADRLLLSPEATAQLGATTRPVGWALRADGVADPDRRDRFVAALRSHGVVTLSYEEGPPANDTRPLLLLLAAASGVITLGAAGVATGLAAAEGRADLSTLAAVGAGPAVRRLLSLCQAGVIAVLGSALGIVAGLGSALIILVAINRRYATSWPVEAPYPLVAPGATLAVLVVVPLVAMLGAGLFTRSRLLVERRLD